MHERCGELCSHLAAIDSIMLIFSSESADCMEESISVWERQLVECLAVWPDVIPAHQLVVWRQIVVETFTVVIFFGCFDVVLGNSVSRRCDGDASHLRLCRVDYSFP